MPPYSDNLYSMVDDDSDLEDYSVDGVLNQFHQQSSQGAFQVGPARQDLPYGDGAAHGEQLNGHDGLYDDVETAADDDDVFSPTDGYFRAAPETGTDRNTLPLGQGCASQWHTTSYNPLPLQLSNSSSPTEQAQQAPHVPNVWVQDPSLQPGSTAESKAREADQERQASREQRGPLNSDDAEATHSNQLHTPTHTSTSSSQRAASSSTVSGYTPYSSQDAYSSYSYSYHHQPSTSSSSAYNNSNNPSYTSYARRQPQQPPYYSNFNPRYFPTPLPVPIEAPPAYTPSPTSPSSSSSPPDTRASGTESAPSSPNYRTFTNNIYRTSTMGGREETEGLLARDPESMGGPTGDDFHHHHQTTSIWGDRIRGQLPYLNRRSGEAFLNKLKMAKFKIPNPLSTTRGKVLLSGLVLLLVTIGLLAGLIPGSGGAGRGDQLDGNLPPPPPKEPITDPSNPPMDDDNGFQWRSGWNCQNTKIARPTEQFEVSFTPDRLLALVQDISSPERVAHPRHVQVQGEVIFRRSGVTGRPSSAIVLEVFVSDERINVATQWDTTSQTLITTVPQTIPWDGSQSSNPCVNILATVWVPANAALSNLSVTTAQLGISLHDNLSLSISTNTRLTSTVGPIISVSTGLPARDEQIFDLGAPDSFQFLSRIIEAKTTSAPIKGSWPLLDYLGLISTSGNIRAVVEPKPVDEDKPAPATLYIKSFSGDVEFREPIHAAQDAFVVAQAWKEAGRGAELAGDLHPEAVLPPRDYRVDVHTTSGNIRGAVAFSTGAAFKTTSGNMHIDLLPVLDSSYASSAQEASRSSALSTGSTSGNTVLYVLEPMWVDSAGGVRYVPFPRAIDGAPGPVQPPTDKQGGKRKEADSPSMIIAAAAAAQAALRCLTSQHTLTSGDMKLHYPAAWEGELSLATNSGRLTAVGDGVEVVKSGRGGPGGLNKYILAKKGAEGASGSRFVAKTTSGDILLTVGN